MLNLLCIKLHVFYLKFEIRDDGNMKNKHLSWPMRKTKDRATTSCKIVETLRLKSSPPNKNAPPIIHIINKIHNAPLSPIQSCWLKFIIWFCIASNFDKGGRGNRMHMTTETPFAPQ